MNEAQVHFRADADRAMGAGHVMRCWALAEEIVPRHRRCVLWTAACPEALVDRFDRLGVTVRHLPAADSVPTEIAAIDAPGLMVFDGYHLNQALRRHWQRPGWRTAAFHDGVGEPPGDCDVVINPAASARADGYRADGVTGTLLLGPDYAPIRREFPDVRTTAPPVSARRRVLLTLGGSDPLGLGPALVGSICDALPAEIGLDIMTGGMNPSLPALRSATQRHERRVTLHVDTSDVARLMADAGLAIAAAGGTAGELACVGTPAILLVLSANQAWAFDDPHAGRWYAAIDGRRDDAVDRTARLAQDLWHNQRNRADMSAYAMSVVDGAGCARIADRLLQAYCHEQRRIWQDEPGSI